MFQSINELAHYPVVQRPRDDSEQHREAARNGLAEALAQWRVKTLAAPLKASHAPLEREQDTYFANGKTLFHRRKDTLTSVRTDPTVTYRMIEVAQQEGWQKVSVKGSTSFRCQAWLYGSLAGIEVRGFEPKKGDLQRLETLQNLQNRLEPGKWEQAPAKPEPQRVEREAGRDKPPRTEPETKQPDQGERFEEPKKKREEADHQGPTGKIAEDVRPNTKPDAMPVLPDYRGRTSLLPHQLDQALEGVSDSQKQISTKAFRILEEWARKERLHPGQEESVIKGRKTVFKYHDHYRGKMSVYLPFLEGPALDRLENLVKHHPGEYQSVWDQALEASFGPTSVKLADHQAMKTEMEKARYQASLNPGIEPKRAMGRGR